MEAIVYTFLLVGCLGILFFSIFFSSFKRKDVLSQKNKYTRPLRRHKEEEEEIKEEN